MSKSICLILTSSLCMDSLFAELEIGLIAKRVNYDEHYESTQFISEACNAYVDFMLMSDQDTTRDDYASNELLNCDFRDSLNNKLFYLVSFSDKSFLSGTLEIINKKLGDYECWVDDDDGNVLTLSEFLLSEK